FASFNFAGQQLTTNALFAVDYDHDGDVDIVDRDPTGGLGVWVQDSAPVIANLDGDSVSYTEGAAPTLLDLGSNGTVTDADSAHYLEDAASTDLFSAVSISTIEAGQTIKQLTMTVTNVTDTTEILLIDGTDVALTNGFSVTTGGNSMLASVVVSSGVATVTLSKGVGVASGAMQTIVDAMTYRDTSQDPAAGNRVVTLTSI